ncbi:hypothetical protein L2E82_51056 [Cichorium intybus]|nr:hypothetical protein L2E82_51056 [Cichorium intybus]
MESFWQKAKSLAADATRRSQALTSSPVRIADIASETAKRSDFLYLKTDESKIHQQDLDGLGGVKGLIISEAKNNLPDEPPYLDSWLFTICKEHVVKVADFGVAKVKACHDSRNWDLQMDGS